MEKRSPRRIETRFLFELTDEHPLLKGAEVDTDEIAGGTSNVDEPSDGHIDVLIVLTVKAEVAMGFGGGREGRL